MHSLRVETWRRHYLDSLWRDNIKNDRKEGDCVGSSPARFEVLIEVRRRISCEAVSIGQIL